MSAVSTRCTTPGINVSSETDGSLEAEAELLESEGRISLTRHPEQAMHRKAKMTETLLCLIEHSKVRKALNRMLIIYNRSTRT